MPPLPNRELTTSEKAVLKYYREYEKEHGNAPTVSQLAHALELHRNSIYNAFKNLQKKGFLVLAPVTSVRLTLSGKAKKAPL
jgi:Mn-dependent DtxR family transcriptional regulator